MKPFRWLGAAIACPVILGLAIHQHVVWTASASLSTIENAEPAPVAIVLGASVRPDGSPSHMLDDRLATAAELFRTGRIDSILVSGDGSGDGYDEVAVMRRELVDRGVPEDRIRLDHAGFRTFDTMRHAHDEFHVRRAIVVTNPFHLHRSVFLAKHAGIDAQGVAARGHHYSGRVLGRHLVREYLARGLAWLDVFVLGTQPS